MKKVLFLLEKTKDGIYNIYEKEGLDLSMFNVQILLKLKVNDKEVNISEDWKRL